MTSQRVMVVEDDPDIRGALCSILEHEGYLVTPAANGAEALSRLRCGVRPAVILLDVMMPVMDGVEFRVAQLQDPELAPIPVVVLTADGRFPEISRTLAAAAAFAKPFELEALLAAIVRVVTGPGAPTLASA